MTNEPDSGDWAKEYQAVAQVIDFAKNPDEPLRSQRFRWSGKGYLLPAGTGHQALENLWALYEEGIERGGDFADSDERMTKKQQKIIGETCRNKPPPLPLRYITVDPEDYSVFGLHFTPLYGVSIHTRLDHCYFLAVTQFEYGFDWAHKRGRLRVFRPRLYGTMRAYPFHVVVNWRPLNKAEPTRELQEVWTNLKGQGVPPPPHTEEAEEERQ